MTNPEDGYLMTKRVADSFGLNEDQTQDLMVYMLERLSIKNLYRSVYVKAKSMANAVTDEPCVPLSDISDTVRIDGMCQFTMMLYCSIRDAAIIEALETLTPREEVVLSKLHGFGEYDKMSRVEIADDFGVSKARIRQIVAKALRKLRRNKRLRIHRL